jgi:hypothetical protein
MRLGELLFPRLPGRLGIHPCVPLSVPLCLVLRVATLLPVPLVLVPIPVFIVPIPVSFSVFTTCVSSLSFVAATGVPRIPIAPAVVPVSSVVTLIYVGVGWIVPYGGNSVD